MALPDKYRPSNINDLLLNESSRSVIIQWLKSWMEHRETKKALILYGQQGIGKTSTAYAIANSAELPVIEMNASEQRNRESMKKIGLMASAYHDLFSTGKTPDKVILIDEADNIFESRNISKGGDTGGMSELLDIIKHTSNPVIVTMNDFYDFKSKNYAGEIIALSLVLDLSPYKRKNETAYRSFVAGAHNILKRIADAENIAINSNKITEIIKNNEPDMRAMINDLYLYKIRENDSENSGRDSSKSIYYITNDTFRKGNYDEILKSLYKMDEDPGFYMNWIDENIPYEYTDLQDLEKAYDLISIADVYYGKRIRDYAMLNYAMEITGGISFNVPGHNSHYVKYSFPVYIKNLSSRKKNNSKSSSRAFMSKLSVISHTSIMNISRDIWFYKKLISGDKETYKLLVKILNLTDNEISGIKK